MSKQKKPIIVTQENLHLIADIACVPAASGSKLRLRRLTVIREVKI